ncbi:unnamed protein product [Rotaria magnacalcarata]|uniref:Methyltransferase FkbM domain-containing protein n=1 Tax=Rotaria magnacalcarata TaxID=392030 RepID=A0A814N950_9BILA|nr:unnamed protein product [Rotaria magnacalcarata]CAF4042042.1 unnamed protein product [Rotaria magnacalcarata]
MNILTSAPKSCRIYPVILLSALLIIILLLSLKCSTVPLWLDIRNLNYFNSVEFQLSQLTPNCTQDKRQLQHYVFQHQLNQLGSWTACYSDQYLLQLYEADLNIPNDDDRILLFDIGANKGYVIATWLSLWMPELGINPPKLYDFLSTKLKLTDCGACSDCKEVGFINASITRRIKKVIEIYAFEPQPSTYQALRQVQQWTNLSSFHVFDLGFSNQTGVAKLSACGTGVEWCGLATNPTSENAKSFVKVNITTLDDFVRLHRIQRRIDVLKIDTEGFDPLVLQGASRLLQEQRIRLMIFEYHGVGMWSTTTLEKVVHNLDRQGYACYQLGRTGILRLTNCWAPIFERKMWSNVLCISRSERILIQSIEKLLV